MWQLHHNGFGFITLSSFILLITFLAILDFMDGVHISSRQSNALYIYILISACKGQHANILEIVHIF